MKSLKKKVLAASVLAGLATGAQAIYVDPNGVGQVLIYPYFTVQNNNNTYVSVVNTTSQGKVVKVRFREGKNSAEVLDFNLYLSPNDVWTGAVIPSSATAGGRLITGDKSCTNPAIPAAGVDFRNFAYSGDGGGNGLERTKEGYIEMLEMATLTGTALNNITHSATSETPANCAAVQGVSVTLSGTAAPTGGLTGTGTLINVANGQDSGYSAVALAAYRANSIYTDIGNDNPNLGNADPSSTVINNNVGWYGSFASTTQGRWDAASSTLMATNVLNEYILDATTLSNTDWVVTFPTKRIYTYGAGNTQTVTTAVAPFSTAWSKTTGNACETVDLVYFSREERTATAAGVDFSPLPPSGDPSALCFEANVVSFRNGAAHTTASGTASGVLGSANATAITLASTFQNGWADLKFSGTGAATTGITAASGYKIDLTNGAETQQAPNYKGLPVVGFMVRTFNNGVLGNFQANYGSAFVHAVRKSIQ